MYQSLVKQYGCDGPFSVRRMTKHYRDKYSGTLVIYGLMMYDLARALVRPADLDWLINQTASMITVMGTRVSTKPAQQLYWYIKNQHITYRTSDYNKLRLYFEKFDDLVATVDFVRSIQDADSLMIESVLGVDELCVTGEVTVSCKTLADYNYKVVTGMFYNHAGEFDRLKKTLTDFSGEIKATGRLREFIDSYAIKNQHRTFVYPCIWSSYFYCKDESSITFLSLAYPGLIKKIYKLHHAKTAGS